MCSKFFPFFLPYCGAKATHSPEILTILQVNKDISLQETLENLEIHDSLENECAHATKLIVEGAFSELFVRCFPRPQADKDAATRAKPEASMTGRPGDHTTEINGGSAPSYLALTPRVPFFLLIFIGLRRKRRSF